MHEKNKYWHFSIASNIHVSSSSISFRKILIIPKIIPFKWRLPIVKILLTSLLTILGSVYTFFRSFELTSFTNNLLCTRHLLPWTLSRIPLILTRTLSKESLQIHNESSRSTFLPSSAVTSSYTLNLLSSRMLISLIFPCRSFWHVTMRIKNAFSCLLFEQLSNACARVCV